MVASRQSRAARSGRRSPPASLVPAGHSDPHPEGRRKGGAKRERRGHGEGWAVVLRRACCWRSRRPQDRARGGAPRGGARLPVAVQWQGPHGLGRPAGGLVRGGRGDHRAQTRAEAPLEGNTFLIWKDGTVGDFTLRLKFRFQPVAGAVMAKANSGVQYRSQVIDPAKRVVGGYQADMDGGGKYVGMLYEERGRGILALPTQKVRLSPEPGRCKARRAHPRRRSTCSAPPLRRPSAPHSRRPWRGESGWT